MMPELYIVLFFVLTIGVSIGSFLNVLIYRIPKKIEVEEKLYAKELLGITDNENESLDNIFRPSKCPKCSNKLKYRHNVPIFGWVFLKGKCFFCKQKVSIEYPIVELVTGLLFVAIVYIYGLNIQSISLLILTIFLFHYL